MNNNDLLHLANQQIQLILLNAFNYLIKLRKYSRTHLLTYQTRYRLYDIQYSFCLHDSCLIKRNHQLMQMQSIEKFADAFIENLFQNTLQQIDKTCRIKSYVNQFIESTIQQALSTTIQSEIEHFSIDLTENILADALSTIVDEHLYTQWRFTDENTLIEQQTSKSIDTLVNNLAQDIYFRSFDNLREIFTNNSLND